MVIISRVSGNNSDRSDGGMSGVGNRGGSRSGSGGGCGCGSGWEINCL